MGHKVEWKFRDKPVSNGDTNIDIKSDAVRYGWKRTIQRVAFENETTGDTEVRVGFIDKMDQISWLAEQETNQAGVLYWTKDLVVLTEGQSLIVRFTDSSSSDVLAVYATGFDEVVRGL